jgi:osmotically-inducible protein OsmY
MVAAGLLPLLGGCALLRRGEERESPAEREARMAGDARIRQEVEARLAAEPAIAAERIRVVVEHAEVQLHGGVEGFGALQCALRNAGLARGVRHVIDLLVLEPGPRDVPCSAPRTFGGAVGTAPVAGTGRAE